MPFRPTYRWPPPKRPYRHKPSNNGNMLFAKLPPEIRCKIWRLLLVRPSGSVMPVHIPRDTATETFFSAEMSPNSTFALNTIVRTCRLFYQDQEDDPVFYKFNVFQFPRTRDCLTYVAAITPSRRNAIRNITITADPIPYSPTTIAKSSPGNRLYAIATLCPNIRVLRHEKFFYDAGSMTDLAVMLSGFLGPLISYLPLLKEVFVRGGHGTQMQMECRMTLKSIEFAQVSTTPVNPQIWLTHGKEFSKDSEELLTAVWDKMCKRRETFSWPLRLSDLKDAISSTPILTLGENRRYQSVAVRAPNNVVPRSSAIATAPDFIINGSGVVKHIWFPRGNGPPDLLIGTCWYTWDAIFRSNLISEACSKTYLLHVVNVFIRKYVSWVYFSRASKGRRHGSRSPQSILINCIWQLEWKDRAAKLDALKELYRHWDKRPRRRR